MNADTKTVSPSTQTPEASAGQSVESFIHGHPFLQGMTGHQLRILSDCAEESRFAAGEVIFCEGDPADRFYLIRRGKVALEAHVKDGGMSLVQTIEAGEALGWSWLFPPSFWHFNARAMEETDAIRFRGRMLREECEADHDLGYELLKRMAETIIQRLQSTRRRLLVPPGMPG